MNTLVVGQQVWSRPQTNLHYQGNWEQYFPIPRDRGGYDTFEILREQLDSKLKGLLEEDIEMEEAIEEAILLVVKLNIGSLLKT